MTGGTGADEEFEQLYLREFPRVLQTTFCLCRDAAVAEETTQEAFARALERWDRLGGQSWLRGWLTTTAVNLIRRQMRMRRRAARQVVSQPVDEVAELWDAVRRLPRREQQPIVLRYRLVHAARDRPRDGVQARDGERLRREGDREAAPLVAEGGRGCED